MSVPIRILGIDPGLRKTGWGVVSKSGSRLQYIAHGVINISPEPSLAERLCALQIAIGDIVKQHKPTLSCVEETFVNVSARSSLALGHARGVILASLASKKLEVIELSPRSIKKTIVGTGSADKAQIQFMIARLLPRAGQVPADAADALACAVSAAHHQNYSIKVRSA